MTVLPSDATAPEHVRAPDPARNRVVVTPLRVIGRWALLLGLTIFAFLDTLQAIRIEIAEHTLLSYLPAAAALCIIAAIGVTLRHEDEPAIYDRDTDFIVGGIVILVAIAFSALLNRRYLPAYLVTHIDLVSLVLFLFSGCVLLFGLRPAMRYRWVWLLSLSLFPLPYRIAVITSGNTRLAAGAAMLLLSVAATAVAVGRTRRRGISGALISFVLGAALLALILAAAPEAPVLVSQWMPAAGSALIVAAFFYAMERRGSGSLRPFPHRTLRPLTTPHVPRAALLLVGSAIVLHLIGAPKVTADPGVTVAGLNTTPPMLVPAEWQQIEFTGLLPSISNGWHAVRSRQVIEQRSGEAHFDYQSRPRRVAVDAVETTAPLTLDIYLPALQYDATGYRTSPPTEVALTGGVTAILQTMVDDQKNVTANRLMWRWNNGVRTQQVTLYSVDNHENTAQFPQFLRNRETWQVVEGMLTLLLRGNAVTEDLDPRFKDQELLTECANALIQTQLLAIGIGHD